MYFDISCMGQKQLNLLIYITGFIFLQVSVVPMDQGYPLGSKTGMQRGFELQHYGLIKRNEMLTRDHSLTSHLWHVSVRVLVRILFERLTTCHLRYKQWLQFSQSKPPSTFTSDSMFFATGSKDFYTSSLARCRRKMTSSVQMSQPISLSGRLNWSLVVPRCCVFKKWWQKAGN